MSHGPADKFKDIIEKMVSEYADMERLYNEQIPYKEDYEAIKDEIRDLKSEVQDVIDELDSCELIDDIDVIKGIVKDQVKELERAIW